MALVGLAHRFRKYGLVFSVFVMAFVQNGRYFQGNGEKKPRGLMPSAGARSKAVKSMGVWRSDETWLYPFSVFVKLYEYLSW